MALKRKNNLIKSVLITVAIAILVILLFSFSSCVSLKLNNIRGSGQIEKKDFEVSGFNTIDFSGIGNITIKQGDTESLRVEAENNVIDKLKISAVGNKLTIGEKTRIINTIPTKPVNFYLSVKDLKKLTISGAGNVKCDKLTTEELSILSSGLGSIEMKLASDGLQVDISGAGKVIISGEVNSQDISISGAGSYEAFNLESKDCKIEISGVGKAELNTVNTLDIRMSGVGSIEYKGNPEVTQNISGGGQIKSVE